MQRLYRLPSEKSFDFFLDRRTAIEVMPFTAYWYMLSAESSHYF